LHATVLQIIDRSVKEERVPTATTVFTGGVSSMDAFLQRFFPEVYRRMKGGGERVSNYCRFDSQLLTAFTSSLYVAGLVSTFFASSVTARCGRRPSMIVAGVAIIAGAAIGGSAVHISMLTLGRVLLGVGLGFGNQVSSLRRVWMLSPYTYVSTCF
jgi:MFS family permease